MKIVIDISQGDYKKVQDGRASVSMMRKVIRNGTPLPKGHGRLIDADEITKDLNTFMGAFVIITDNVYGMAISCKAPTIIEADKESEE